MAEKLRQLKEVALKLDNFPIAKDVLVKLLEQAATCLSELYQSPTKYTLEALQTFFDAIVKPELLKHQDRDVRLLVGTCVCEITRITAPEAPYNDDILKDIFRLIVSIFAELSDISGPSFGRRVVILEALARYRLCVVMLDLECFDLITEMINTFFAVVSDEHPENVLTSMQTIMVLLLEDSEGIKEEHLLAILSSLGEGKNESAARKLAVKVIEKCAGKLEPGIQQFLISSMSGDNKSSDNHINYHEVIYDIYRCAPQILLGVIPYLTGELLTDQLDTRLKAVKLAGDLFALPGSTISNAFQPIFSEFLKRLTDRVVDVRMSVLEQIKVCLLSNPSRAEAPQIIAALCDRLLDYDENIRKQVVAVICDVACQSIEAIPAETIKLVAERLRDKSLLVKIYTMDRLADMYRLYCLKCSDGSIGPIEFDWIAGKILRCFYDKGFRSDVIESVLSGSNFPNEVSVKDKVKHWVRVFSGFDKVEVKALEKLLEQKQRLQQEMQKYLSLRQMSQMQSDDAPENQKKIILCFRIMSLCFPDSLKAEENFQILDQLKDVNIWKILFSLLDPNTSFLQASTYRDDLLKILSKKHPLYHFLSALSMKCSYLLFNKEHVKELLKVVLHKSAENGVLIFSSMNLLVILASFFPSLLGGFEEDIVNLLNNDDEILKEGALQVLAKAGGTIREQLATLSSPVELTLERLCLEGSRKQAKYSVHALAAITKDDGLKSLSVLFKNLVDMLEEKNHLPAVLQSLGCIAQTAMAVYETKESEIENCIRSNILNCNSNNEKAGWDDRSELCSLKIYGIKTLVKSYLPAKDANLRVGIDRLFDILKNILLYGEISKDIESSSIDKAHLRLASAKAILRLSRHWDHMIPVDIFYLTLKTSEVNFPQVKKLFLAKVHQYIKDRVLDVKYACAFVLNLFGVPAPEFEEDKHSLSGIFLMCHQVRARSLSMQTEANSLVVYPEYILPYLVHGLAHESCPDIDECKDVHAFESIYRLLHLILSMIVHGDEVGMSEGSTSKEKERTATISSIFLSIKRSEDIVDAKKSKNSHALCDIGLSIIKRFSKEESDLVELTSPISLPAVLYRLNEKQEEDYSNASKGHSWLADEMVVAHFESLKVDTKETVELETLDDCNLKETEKDGTEVPLGKMIKHIKSKRNKGRKMMHKKCSPLVKAKNTESDVDDIMKMVKELNSDNVEGVSGKFESSNGHAHTTPDIKPKLEKVKNQKNKRPNVSESNSVPAPKRRRSSSSHNALKVSRPWRSSKDSVNDLADDLHQTGSEANSDSENLHDYVESDLLESCLRKSNCSSSSERKGRGSHQDHIGKAHDIKPAVKVVPDIVDTIKSKKRKRSMAGLAKCSSKEEGNQKGELIGCRIQVWWPMDKAFYEGVVKSYDPKKNKHVVLYDDGDEEVLRLDKQKWELVDNDHKSKTPKSLKNSSEPKNSSGSRKNRRSAKMDRSSSRAKGERTPKKKIKTKNEASLQSTCESESRENSDTSDVEPTTTSPVQDVNTSDHEYQNTEKDDKSDTEKLDSASEERKQIENMDLDDTQKTVEKKENCHVEEKDAEESAIKDQKLTSEFDNIIDDDKKETGNQEKSQQLKENEDPQSSSATSSNRSHEENSNSSEADDLEYSDDETLSNWQSKALGKSIKAS